MSIVLDKFALFFLFLGSIFAVGCVEDYSSYCSEIIKCQDGNQNDMERCIDELESAADRADANNCQVAFDNYFSCLSSKSSCLDERWTDNEKCDNEDKDLRRCRN